MVEKKETSHEEKKNIELVDVATQTTKMFKIPSGEVLEMHDYLVWIGNEIQKIKGAIV